MTPLEVRQWARRRGVSPARFRQVYERTLLFTISRLFQAIYRESRLTRLAQDAQGRWYLEMGRQPRLRARVSGALPFRRLETIRLPVSTSVGKKPRRIRTLGAFLRALRISLRGSQYESVFDALRSDFENSFANLIFNRLLGGSLSAKARALEPAYQGHQYYPFPALRIGPRLEQIVECSNLCEKAVDLPLVELDGYRLISAEFRDFGQCVRAWSGLEPAAEGAALLPVHPWQLELSPVLRRLLEYKHARLSKHAVKAVPLTSQRTCRVLRTGYDLKLSINATLTGELRLLHRLNCENAPFISLLAQHLAAADGGMLDFQRDLATLLHAEAALAPHLSAIVRAPLEPREGERIVAAINLWAGPEEARKLLNGSQGCHIEEFFAHYARALMSGPVRFCSQWGMAFEPHLQNVYVVFRGALPARIVLRDLDNSILDARRARPLLRKLAIDLPPESWRAMPSYEIGCKRMVQAMLFGHLGEVMWRLSETSPVTSRRLAGIVEDTWAQLVSRAPSASARQAVKKMRKWSEAVKATLRTRLNRSTTMEFV